MKNNATATGYMEAGDSGASTSRVQSASPELGVGKARRLIMVREGHTGRLPRCPPDCKSTLWKMVKTNLAKLGTSSS